MTAGSRIAEPSTAAPASAHMTRMETIPGLDFTAIDFEAANRRKNRAAMGSAPE